MIKIMKMLLFNSLLEKLKNSIFKVKASIRKYNKKMKKYYKIIILNKH